MEIVSIRCVICGFRNSRKYDDSDKDKKPMRCPVCGNGFFDIRFEKKEEEKT